MKSISFIIPVYNEEKRLPKTFKALRELKIPKGLKLESVVFVDDGSVDATASKIKKYQKYHEYHRYHGNKKQKARDTRDTRGTRDTLIKLISYPINRGKGFAIRAGMLAADSDYNLFFDADMSTPLSELKKFVPFMEKGVDVIIGTRKNGESTVIKHQPFIREKLGRVFTLMTQIILNTWVSDFTCGFKAFSRETKNQIFSRAVINRWGYDAELIFLARKLKFSMQEKAVVWANDEGTKVNLFKAIPQTLSELFKIRITHSLRTQTASTKLNLGVTK